MTALLTRMEAVSGAPGWIIMAMTMAGLLMVAVGMAGLALIRVKAWIERRRDA